MADRNPNEEQTMVARRLIKDLMHANHELRVVEGELRVRPRPSPELLQRLRDNRDLVMKVIGTRGPAAPDPNTLGDLRSFLPALWELVRLPDGDVGLLWGVTARGVIVSPGPGRALITFDASDVQRLNPGE